MAAMAQKSQSNQMIYARLTIVLCMWFFPDASTVRADLIFYGGNFAPVSGALGLTNGRDFLVGNTASVGDAFVFDDFTIGSNLIVSGLFSHNLTNFTPTDAYWEIRSGITLGNGGSLIAFGQQAATVTLDGVNPGNGFNGRKVEVAGLNVQLSPGQYWITVAPVGSGTGRSFLETTTRQNAVGSLPQNAGNSFFTSATIGSTYTTALNEPIDFRFGVNGSFSAVPEPSSFVLLGCVAFGLARYRRLRASIPRQI